MYNTDESYYLLAIAIASMAIVIASMVIVIASKAIVIASMKKAGPE